MIYWTYEDWYGNKADLECDTRLAAVHIAEDKFEQDSELSHNETREDICYILQYNYDEETGDITLLSREPYTLFVEGYHGNYIEHNTRGL